MAKQPGFKLYARKTAEKVPAHERIKNYKSVYIPQSEEEIRVQSSRCMDCGVAYCNHACPLGNILPDLNYLVAEGQWKKALDVLHCTNNFPEFTGRLCPALCEAACVLGINQEPATNREMELSIIEKGFQEGWVKPLPPKMRTGHRVAVVGSGPAGLSAAQQLTRSGHEVTVFERSENIGGILALGIPDYKLEKWVLERRLEQLRAEGIIFKTDTNVGVHVSADSLKSKFDAVCLAGGSTIPRDLDVEGRSLGGIHFAMDYLSQQNLVNQGKEISEERINAAGKNVVIIGGGDTGADCLGVAIRQGAKEVYQFEFMPQPPSKRTEKMPWPAWPMILHTNTAHEEGGKRRWCVATKFFSGSDGQVKNVHCIGLKWLEDEKGKKRMEETPGSEFTLDADMVLFAMGFIHPEQGTMLKSFGVAFDERGNVKTDAQQMTNITGVFSAGDMRTGQSLVCKAIADGRAAAAAIDHYLRNQ